MRATGIRKRDGGRCRLCNRDEEEVRVEVHHRVYGALGPCGRCVLTGVDDDDLVTLCVDCHDATTTVRRNIRYAKRPIKRLSWRYRKLTHQSRRRGSWSTLTKWPRSLLVRGARRHALHFGKRGSRKEGLCTGSCH
jgi:hypothetical protein